ncbi:TonB-dependent receptor [Catenovulum agarivorans]|uniref:TonB-dependent receptor n=1 Tax=Catenovulum agarivorans TaxID=1172192 RepID=UPI00030C201D|nr:TonB-dependent receptor [Catenovulum agarivorans]
MKSAKYSLVAVVLAANSAVAADITGKIFNDKGEAVENADVSIMGTALKTTTNELGQFTFSDLNQDHFELHVSAKGYVHSNTHVELEGQDRFDVAITLAKSIIEVIDVTASPFHASIIESSIPVEVVAGETLRRRQAATLGDTLEHSLGIHTNFYANVASTPVVRGLSGPRVLITQNGLDVGDVSRVGPDHSVTSEVSTAEQIEIFRGPATLFYGSGAIGGVVNVVDNRVPRNKDTSGELLAEYNQNNNQKLFGFNANTSVSDFAFHIDAFDRQADDYTIAQADEHGHDTVENSAEESNGYTLGSSYIFEDGFVGVSYGRLEREYGIPGHAHGDEEEHEDEEHLDEAPEDEHHEDEHDVHAEESVFASLKQNRYQLISEINFENDLLRTVKLKAAQTDYQHAEIEGDEVGTVFESKTSEVRLDLLHQTFAEWRGGVSLHAKRSEFAAQGDEAFTPASTTEAVALALMEETHIGDVLIQLGARVEKVNISVGELNHADIELHHHDEDEHEEHHEEAHEEHHDEEEHGELHAARELDFTPVSWSAGLVWDFADGYNVGLSYSRAQRAPSAAELFAFGPHIATGTYEIGAIYEMHEEGEEIVFEPSMHDLDVETSKNIDFALRKFSGDFGFVFNAFYNQIDNYYYQTPTEYFVEVSHEEHGHEDEHAAEADHEGEHEEDVHADELPLYYAQSKQAKLHGFELQTVWQVNNVLKASFFADYVKARLKDGSNLPLTPPMKSGIELDFQQDNYSLQLNWTRYFKQDDVAEHETSTAGYNWLDATASYYLPAGGIDWTFYVKGRNLTDADARVHSSFLKDLAPKPGRSVIFGVRGNF